jgi:oxygen-independent coproporphyrinogen III oxidase
MHYPASELVIDPVLIRKYDVSGPRYTSYPTADRFVEAFGPLSLYVHLPFCTSLCYYCACNKIITRNPAKAEKYLRYLHREIALQAPLFRDDPRVDQMHWGGGTPTFFGIPDLKNLFDALRSQFDFAERGEYSIEIDPRTVSPETMNALRDMGFNRVSFGVQDFDPAVQRAVNRVQSVEQTGALMEAARAAGFSSINIDLIYGLPLQTLETFERTLQSVSALAPDRVAVYSYAHLPTRFKAQKQILTAELPAPGTKLRLLGLAAERLTGAGYVYVGMDHFALPDDPLAVAQRMGRLHRNFQGYSTHADCDLIGLGVSAIGAIGPT